LVRWTTWRTH